MGIVIPFGIIVVLIIIGIVVYNSLRETSNRNNFYRRFHERYTSVKKGTPLTEQEQKIYNDPKIHDILKTFLNDLFKK